MAVQPVIMKDRNTVTYVNLNETGSSLLQTFLHFSLTPETREILWTVMHNFLMCLFVQFIHMDVCRCSMYFCLFVCFL